MARFEASTPNTSDSEITEHHGVEHSRVERDFDITAPHDLSRSASQYAIAGINLSRDQTREIARRVRASIASEKKDRRKIPNKAGQWQASYLDGNQLSILMIALIGVGVIVFMNLQATKLELERQNVLTNKVKESVDVIRAQLETFWTDLERKQAKLNHKNRVFCEREVTRHYSNYLADRLQADANDLGDF